MAQQQGLIDEMPCYTTFAHYTENLKLTPTIKELIAATSLAPATIELDFSMDSSGFGTTWFVKWFDHKCGKEVDSKACVRHMVCDFKTNIDTLFNFPWR